jgi:hypothetical protein
MWKGAGGFGVFPHDMLAIKYILVKGLMVAPEERI